MKVRGIRGATTVSEDKPELIIEATKELLSKMEKDNSLDIREIAAVTFVVTPDLKSAYPALAARELGWTSVPLLCYADLAVVGSLPRCIRVLILYNTHLDQDEIVHVYLRGAKVLRPDLVGG
ncbi:MAG: chorismate mutase [Firmicutes bacterium]|nr:chorismate mutase [Bacillota bacterium]